MRKTIKSYKVDAAGLFSPCLEGFTTVRNHINKNNHRIN